MGATRWMVLGCTSLLACGGGDAAEDADVSNDDLSDDAIAPDAAPSGHRLSIAFDYRYDDAAFFTPAARATLEAAAAAWGDAIGDDFEMIPAGTSVRSRDPEAPEVDGTSFNIDVAIDDVLVFVGCSHIDGPSGITATSNSAAAINSVVDAALRDRLSTRYYGANFEPWTAWISFDCDESWYFDQDTSTDADIPGADRDFWTVAMHELAHTLGFGTADAHFALVNGTPAFTGAAAAAEHGGPVPMTASGTHFADGVMSDGVAPLMDQSRPNGSRFWSTPLDLAALVDLGYELR